MAVHLGIIELSNSVSIALKGHKREHSSKEMKLACSLKSSEYRNHVDVLKVGLGRWNILNVYLRRLS